MFIPTTGKAKRKVGTPAGKVRVVGYSLCRRCFGKPGIERLVEKAILKDFGRQASAQAERN